MVPAGFLGEEIKTLLLEASKRTIPRSCFTLNVQFGHVPLGNPEERYQVSVQIMQLAENNIQFGLSGRDGYFLASSGCWTLQNAHNDVRILNERRGWLCHPDSLQDALSADAARSHQVAAGVADVALPAWVIPVRNRHTRCVTRQPLPGL